MALALFAVTGLISLNLCSGSQSWLELNPDLQQYQDLSKCFPLPETWYMIYRNYESDPPFGGTAKCVRFTENGSSDNGSYPLLFESVNQTSDVTATLESSTGYTAKNVMRITIPGGGDPLMVYGAYTECGTCSVLRNTYIDDSACALLVPKSQLGTNSTCCDFIFDLLCGSGEKYYIYDESC
ncbi:unnamed protein product [Ixodes hexagonus]